MSRIRHNLDIFDAVLVLGKELRRDPSRARRELRARSAAAAVAWRAGASRVLTLEAPLAGQQEAGSAIVCDHLVSLGVSADAILQRAQTRSTREEAICAHALVQAEQLGRLLVITSRYHVPRARQIFADVFGPARASVHAPTGFLRGAVPTERDWILAGVPSEQTMEMEGRTERWLLRAARALSWMPQAARWQVEVQAGALLRRADAGKV